MQHLDLYDLIWRLFIQTLNHTCFEAPLTQSQQAFVAAPVLFQCCCYFLSVPLYIYSFLFSSPLVSSLLVASFRFSSLPFSSLVFSYLFFSSVLGNFPFGLDRGKAMMQEMMALNRSKKGLKFKTI